MEKWAHSTFLFHTQVTQKRRANCQQTTEYKLQTELRKKTELINYKNTMYTHTDNSSIILQQHTAAVPLCK